jgi:hypothetical protein
MSKKEQAWDSKPTRFDSSDVVYLLMPDRCKPEI